MNVGQKRVSVFVRFVRLERNRFGLESWDQLLLTEAAQGVDGAGPLAADG